MKPSIFLGLALLCVGATTICAPVAHAQPEVLAAPTALGALSATQVLEKSRQAYAGFRVYKGSCSVVRDSVFAVGDGAPRQVISSAGATFDFERGKKLSIEGVDMGGGAFKAQWTPGETWLEMTEGREKPGDVGELKREVIEGEPDFSARDTLFASLSGVTAGTGSQIPNALMPDEFGLGNPFSELGAQLGTHKFLPARNLGNGPCYVIEQTIPELNLVTTYWIEQKTFLLRRLTEEIGEKSYDDMPLVNGVEMPVAMRMAYSFSQFVFATTEAK